MVDIHLWHRQALAEAIAILQVLPADEKLRFALNALDLLEIEWREAMGSGTVIPADEPKGRHHRGG